MENIPSSNLIMEEGNTRTFLLAVAKTVRGCGFLMMIIFALSIFGSFVKDGSSVLITDFIILGISTATTLCGHIMIHSID